MRIGLDVRRWEADRVSDTVSSDYVSGKGVAMAEELVCMVNIALYELLAYEGRRTNLACHWAFDNCEGSVGFGQVFKVLKVCAKSVVIAHK